ncbi:sphingosine-1-phosphate lyase isoform X1 [Dermacentor variabilis]|uniref:sphingosine-1-phosphate lyase isoform X1 n=1 Tax=Dermacentor variabilis TaxID=34621 RepID=UPI003F5BBEE4
MPDSSLKESLLYAFWRVCGLVNFHRDMLNAKYQNTEPAVLIVTTALVTYVGHRVLCRLIYGEGFVPNVRRGLLTTLRNLPVVRDYVQEKMGKIAVDVEQSLNKCYADCQFILELPEKGWTPDAILEGMAQNDSLGHVEWKKGVVSGAIYTEHDPKLEGLMVSVFERHLRSNPLHSDVFIGVRKMESEVIRWCCKLFHGGPDSCGSMTSGGTESLILACKAHRDYGFFEKGIVYPEMVVPATAHAGFDKAGEYLRIKVIHVPVDPQTMKVDVRKMKAAITGNTILLVGSSPQFPHGSIDPIKEIAELGAKYGISVHVDACLGGFLVPFMEEAGFPLPPFDFRLEGVTSISADTHKYGYTPKGSSMVLYRSRKYHHYQFSVATDWPGGVYATPTMSGSRAGSVAACTWASLLYYGREGYIEATRKIIITTRKIVDGLRAVPGIQVLGSPDVSVVAVGSEKFDIFQLMDKLTQRGWNLNPLQYPSGFHLCVTLLHVAEKVADRFVRDVRECTADIMRAPHLPSTGKAAIYGMAQSIPDRSVIEELAHAYIDACYSTRYIPPS